jgi:hypothetical protein
LRLGGRERQSGEPGGERYRNRNSADTHGVSRRALGAEKPSRSCGSGLAPNKSAAIGDADSLHGPLDFGRAARRRDLCSPSHERSIRLMEDHSSASPSGPRWNSTRKPSSSSMTKVRPW